MGNDVETAVRISPNVIVTDDLDYVLKMSATRSAYSRSDYYGITAFDCEVNHVFCEINEQRHFELRNKVASGICIAVLHKLLRWLTITSIPQKRTCIWSRVSILRLRH
jgi:hypothetical protein